MQILAFLSIITFALNGLPLTSAEEDGYFDLARPYVQERSRLDTFDLVTTPDAVRKCAKAEELAELSHQEVAVLTAYLGILKDQGRSIEPLLHFYLVSTEGAARASVNAYLDCAYDSYRSDGDALTHFAGRLLADVPPPPSGTSMDLAGFRAIMVRDVWLDEAVDTVERLRDAKTSGAEVQKMVEQLPHLTSEREDARKERIKTLGKYEASPSAQEILQRQVLRKPASERPQ